MCMVQCKCSANSIIKELEKFYFVRHQLTMELELNAAYDTIKSSDLDTTEDIYELPEVISGKKVEKDLSVKHQKELHANELKSKKEKRSFWFNFFLSVRIHPYVDTDISHFVFSSILFKSAPRSTDNCH